MSAAIDLSGKRFSNLVVVARVSSDKQGVRWSCQCDCGGTIVAYAKELRAGHTKGCGCRQKRRTHGLSFTPTYRSWCAMHVRCGSPRHPAFHRYGGRGITVCDRWKGRGGFDAFLSDMGIRPPGRTLDRINNDGKYEPGNCRWSTPKEQRANQSAEAS